MFEFNGRYLRIYGFKSIGNVNENRATFLYGEKKIIVSGININVINLIDKGCDIEGIINHIEVEYNCD